MGRQRGRQLPWWLVVGGAFDVGGEFDVVVVLRLHAGGSVQVPGRG